MIEQQFVYRSIFCVIRFNEINGCRAGYICIPIGNRYYKMPPKCEMLKCPGGITYMTGLTKYLVNLPNEDDQNFYIGFDCAHIPMDAPDIEYMKNNNIEINDYVKQSSELAKNGHIWTMDEVKEEIHNLVDQVLRD